MRGGCHDPGTAIAPLVLPYIGRGRDVESSPGPQGLAEVISMAMSPLMTMSPCRTLPLGVSA